MTGDLRQQIDNIEIQMAASTDAERVQLVHDLNALVDRMAEDSATVPAELRDRIHALIDEATEDQFDNMPI